MMTALGPNQLAHCRQWVAFRELEQITERIRKEREESERRVEKKEAA